MAVFHYCWEQSGFDEDLLSPHIDLPAKEVEVFAYIKKGSPIWPQATASIFIEF